MKTECLRKKWRYKVKIYCEAVCACVQCVCVCINMAAGTTEKRLIIADVFQRAQLSCLMWKTFTRFFVLLFKNLASALPSTLCCCTPKKPKENPPFTSHPFKPWKLRGMQKILFFFSNGYHNLYFFPPTWAYTLPSTDRKSGTKEGFISAVYVTSLKRKVTLMLIIVQNLKITFWYCYKGGILGQYTLVRQ